MAYTERPCKVLAALWIIAVSCHAEVFSVDDIAQVTTSVMLHYRSYCVYLLYSAQLSQKDMFTYVQLQSNLMDRYVLTSLILLDNLNMTDQTSLCQASRPIFTVAFPTPVASLALDKVSATTNLAAATWLLFLDRGSPEEFLGEADVPFDCEFLVAWRSGTVVELTELYRVSRGRPVTASRWGRWSPELGLNSPSKFLYKRRNNLEGLMIKGVVLHSPPVVVVWNVSGTLLVGGFLGMLWNVLETKLNFSTVYCLPKDGVYGWINKNNTWTGMLGMVANKEVDVALSEFNELPERMVAVDYTTPITRSVSVGIMQTVSSRHNWNNLLAPFSKQLWVAVGVTAAVMAACLSAVHTLGRKFCNKDVVGPDVFGLYNTWHCVFGMFCLQAHQVTPRALSSRIVYLVGYLMVVVIFAGYSASLISNLAKEENKGAASSFKDLLDDGNFRLGILRESSYLNLLSTTKYEQLQNVYTRLVEPYIDDMPHNVSQGIARVCQNPKYMFLLSLNELFGNMLTDPTRHCKLWTHSTFIFPEKKAMMLKKGSPLRKIIDYYILEMKDAGLLKAFYSRSFSSWPMMSTTTLGKVDLETVAPILAVLAMGLGLAVLVLLAERTLKPGALATSIKKWAAVKCNKDSRNKRRRRQTM